MNQRIVFLALCLCLSLLGAGCRRDQQGAGAAEAPEKVSQEERQRLLALPYAGFTEEAATGERSGTLRYDPARSYPGYNLYTSRNLRLTELIDANGRVLRSWHQESSGAWVRSVLLPAGDLLVAGWYTDSEDPGARYLMRLSWDNEVIWKHRLPVHHDVAPAPGGRFVALTFTFRRAPDIHPVRPIRDDHIVLLTAAGEVVEERSLYDMMSARLAPVNDPPGTVKTEPIDFFHANAVRWLDDPALEAWSPIYSTRNVLVTSRTLDSVLLFDWDTAELVWSWGRGELSGPHDARMLANGNILVFDNGIQRSPPWSRVLEVNPVTREIEWEYVAPKPTSFYSLSRGASQRLPNGNTLITDSDSGRAFEVTVDGEVVWEFLSPNLDSHDRRASIVRLYRYEEDFVQAIQQRSP